MTNKDALKILRWIVQKMNNFSPNLTIAKFYHNRPFIGQYVLIETPIVSINFLTTKYHVLISAFSDNRLPYINNISASTANKYINKLKHMLSIGKCMVMPDNNDIIIPWLNQILYKDINELLIETDLN